MKQLQQPHLVEGAHSPQIQLAFSVALHLVPMKILEQEQKPLIDCRANRTKPIEDVRDY
jgi:hypothetical protein